MKFLVEWSGINSNDKSERHSEMPDRQVYPYLLIPVCSNEEPKCAQ